MHARQRGRKGSILDAEVRRDEGHDGVPSVGKPLDVFCARWLSIRRPPPRVPLYVCWLTTAILTTCVHTCTHRHTYLVHAVQWWEREREEDKEEALIWNRGSKLIGCEVQGTLSLLAPYVEEPNKTENVVTFDQGSSSSYSSLLPYILFLAIGAPTPFAMSDQCRGFVYCFVHEIPYLVNTSIRQTD